MTTESANSSISGDNLAAGTGGGNNSTSGNSVSMNSSRSSFTEAVPLSLSSLAHLTIPLEEGIVNGMREMVQHTQLACVNYARATSVNQYSLKELWVDDWVWTKKSATAKDVLPPALAKLNCFKHSYEQQVKLCLGQPDKTVPPTANWMDDKLVLGTVSLYYASEELFTNDELNGDTLNDSSDAMNDDDDDDDDDDMPNCILYKVLVEYRSLPPTDNQVAVEAEELSMLSFGGSVDDAVKYGALASLYDDHAKYSMEICSVRGRKYKFDLMDSTLSDGRLPRWKPRMGVAEPPFTKSLCVTVTDHNHKDCISRLSLSLDGNALRKPKDCHPALHFYTKKLEESFLLWRKPVSIMALPSRQSLLLNADLGGHVFVDGRYMTTWGEDAKIGTGVTALFGIDVHSIIPVWHGRIVDYDVLKQVYATAWQEAMIDSRLMGIDLASMLLYRLMYGKDESDVYDDDDDAVDTSSPTLESQVMSSAKYDPVGICAKALATRFAAEFGKEAFPVLSHDVQAVKQQLGHKTAVVVPARLISVLRRGGYFDIARTVQETWFTEGVRAADTEAETALLTGAVQLLADAGGDDVLAAHVLFVKIVDPQPEKHYNLCRYQIELSQYYVNETWALATTAFWIALAIARAHPEGGLVEKRLLEKHLVTTK